MDTGLPKEFLDELIEKLNETVVEIQSLKNKMADFEKRDIRDARFARLSKDRKLYTIEQASFKMNCSRNDFMDKYVETGLVKVLIQEGNIYVPNEELNNFIAHQSKFSNLKSKTDRFLISKQG